MNDLLLEVIGWFGYLERPAVLLQVVLVISLMVLSQRAKRLRWLRGVPPLAATPIGLATLALAPSAPKQVQVQTKQLENDTVLQWAPNPEPDLAGYRVVWRDTTSAFWQGSQWVGNVRQARIKLSKDNYLFGVQAVDKDGNEVPKGEHKYYQMKDGPKHTYKCDYAGMKVVEERIQNGFRLFGRYYQSLWD